MDKTFYNDSQIRVTDTELILRDKVVPLEEIIAVDHIIDKPRKIGLPTAVLAFSLLGLLETYLRGHSSLSWIFFGCALASALRMVTRRESYTVSILQPRERLAVLVSQNQQFTYAVLGAIRQALSCRQQPG